MRVLGGGHGISSPGGSWMIVLAGERLETVPALRAGFRGGGDRLLVDRWSGSTSAEECRALDEGTCDEV